MKWNSGILILYVLLMSISLSAQIPQINYVSYIEAGPLGGMKQVKKLVQHEMYYPESALKNKEEGKVTIKFRLDEKGEVVQRLIARSVSRSIDEEAFRIFDRILWHPALYQNHAEGTTQILNIRFSIGKYKRWVKQRGYEKPLEMNVPKRCYPRDALDEAPMATFKGEEVNLARYIYQELKYPEEAYRRNLSGEVVIQFVVEPSGYISNLHMEKTIGGGCVQEAERLITELKWKPGKRNGAVVRTLMEATILFQLPDSAPEYQPNTGHNASY